MPNGLQTIEQLLVTEDWELGRQIIVETEDFRDIREEIEGEYDISLDNLVTIIALPADFFETLKQRILTAIESRIEIFNDAMYQLICVEWDYCARRGDPMTDIAEHLIGAILDLMVTGGASVAILLLKRGYFDGLCQCPL